MHPQKQSPVCRHGHGLSEICPTILRKKLTSHLGGTVVPPEKNTQLHGWTNSRKISGNPWWPVKPYSPWFFGLLYRDTARDLWSLALHICLEWDGAPGVDPGFEAHLEGVGHRQPPVIYQLWIMVHLYRWIIQWKRWCSIVMLNYQRVYQVSQGGATFL